MRFKMITVQGVKKSYGSRVLFENVDIAFDEGCRYGLTGPNGAGKSTFLKIMTHEEAPDSGTISLPDSVGILRQNINDYAKFTLIDAVIQGNKALWDAMQKRDALYDQEMTDSVGMELANLEEIVMEQDGYNADSQAQILLEGMGIESSFHYQQMFEVPTDFQFRVLLCQALFGKPQALILDEPTNHLDMTSISWLEEFLMGYQGTVIVVSHDRHFLNRITTHIADIDYENIILYPGNYDQMIISKTQVRKQAEEEKRSKEKKIERLREFVAKFAAGSRASQVQSRVKEINRLQPQQLKESNIQRPYINFPMENSKQPGQVVLKASGLAKEFDVPVFKNFDFEVLRNDKIGIIGNNGVGKTTLIKTIAKMIDPSAGEFQWGHNVDLGYFPQNHEELVDKDSRVSIFDWLKQQVQGTYDQDVRSVLGRMLFSGQDALKPLCALSGGETARLIMSLLMLRPHNVLLLDEPNNHLDLESVSALAQGIKRYQGTCLFITHDRSLLDEAATKIIDMATDVPTFYPGNIEEYLVKKDKVKA